MKSVRAGFDSQVGVPARPKLWRRRGSQLRAWVFGCLDFFCFVFFIKEKNEKSNFVMGFQSLKTIVVTRVHSVRIEQVIAEV